MFKYILRSVSIVFFLLGIVGTAFLVWFFYMAALRPAFEKKWVQIPSPSEPLNALKVGDAGEIFAEGRDGGLYQFSMYPELAWINVKENENVYSGITCRPITDNTYKSEPMSDTVKAHVSVDCSFAEQALYLDIDLLENGETWYFEKSSNSYVTIGLIIILPVGLVIDIALYMIGLLFLAPDLIIALRQKSTQT